MFFSLALHIVLLLLLLFSGIGYFSGMFSDAWYSFFGTAKFNVIHLHCLKSLKRLRPLQRFNSLYSFCFTFIIFWIFVAVLWMLLYVEFRSTFTCLYNLYSNKSIGFHDGEIQFITHTHTKRMTKFAWLCFWKMSMFISIRSIACA